MIKIKEFRLEARKKDLRTLERDLLELQKNYFSNLIHETTREKKNPAKLKLIKKQIAIIKTIIREKIVESIKDKDE